MTRQKKGRSGWWLLTLILAAAGVFLYYTREGTPPPSKVPPPAPPVETSAAPPPVKQPIPSPVTPQSGASAVPAGPATSQTGKNDCARLEQDVRGFFHYLDGRRYLHRRYPHLDSLARYRKILARLSAHPPVPAGEGKDPGIILGNLYHFFRVLGRKDLLLIREILENESDALEINLDLFYRWAVSGDRCPDPAGLRPSMETLYAYAGFFLNTTGGRGYLFRRSFATRLLVTYYCLRIIHLTDRTGKNREGINIYPVILDLKTEIAHYSDFEFQRDYMDGLDRMARYYREKRQPAGQPAPG